MTDKTIDLDRRRGMEAQKATDLRRLLAEVEANERALRLRQEELEAHLADAPAANWEEAPEKARYVLGLYAATLTAERPNSPRSKAGAFLCGRDLCRGLSGGVNNVTGSEIDPRHNIRSCVPRISADTVQASHSLLVSEGRNDWSGPA
jgi:hypothetical protein